MTFKVNWRERLIRLPRMAKVGGQVFFDLAFCFLSGLVAISLLGGKDVRNVLNPINLTFVSMGLFLPVAIALGLYKMVIRFIGWRSCLRIALLASIYFVFLMCFPMLGLYELPWVYAIIQPAIFFIFLVGWRSVARLILDNGISPQRLRIYKQSRVLIYGAGSAGRQLATCLIIDGKASVVGFIDDDTGLHGCTINGVEVFARNEIDALVSGRQATDLYLAIPSLTRRQKHELLAVLSDLPLAVRSLPTVPEIVDGKVHISDLGPVLIEDVLGREVVAPDARLLNKNIRGRVVLITGAGGSIGSEIARQVLRQEPKMLILFEQSEHALYEIERELGLSALKIGRDKRIRAVLGSVTEKEKLIAVCTTFGVGTIYHAAAYKHVPLVEQNPLMGIWNNVIGTWRLAESAVASGVDTFVLISTDKAVRPTSIMGCTKRIAELIMQAKQNLGSDGKSKTKFTMVRFGNVLGSSGSVIPAFKEQIQSGGPVTVTHPEMVRYFMTIPEAAELVIQAGALGNGGDVMVLNMGEPIRIRDLAEKMIHLSGLRVKSETDPDGDIEIAYTGLRPGEKLYEELLIDNNTSSTQHPRICLARENMVPWDVLEPKLRQLEEAVVRLNSEAARRVIQELVPEFVPQCKNQDWMLMNPYIDECVDGDNLRLRMKL